MSDEVVVDNEVESIAQGIVDFFMACPLLKDGAFRVDSLGGHAKVEYTLEFGLYNPISQTYINGDTERIVQFNFGSREYYSLDRLNNIANSEFYEKFANWVEEQERNENYPKMPEKCTPRMLEVLSPGFVYSTDMNSARYQIQLRLTYYKEV